MTIFVLGASYIFVCVIISVTSDLFISSFIAKTDSKDVFDATRGNPENYGLRDKDYLLDEEIGKIRKKHNNYLTF